MMKTEVYNYLKHIDVNLEGAFTVQEVVELMIGFKRYPQPDQLSDEEIDRCECGQSVEDDRHARMDDDGCYTCSSCMVDILRDRAGGGVDLLREYAEYLFKMIPNNSIDAKSKLLVGLSPHGIEDFLTYRNHQT